MTKERKKEKSNAQIKKRINDQEQNGQARATVETSEDPDRRGGAEQAAAVIQGSIGPQKSPTSPHK